MDSSTAVRIAEAARVTRERVGAQSPNLGEWARRYDEAGPVLARNPVDYPRGSDERQLRADAAVALAVATGRSIYQGPRYDPQDRPTVTNPGPDYDMYPSREAEEGRKPLSVSAGLFWGPGTREAVGALLAVVLFLAAYLGGR